MYVCSSYIGVVVWGSGLFARLHLDGCSERLVGRPQVGHWGCLHRRLGVHLYQVWYVGSSASVGLHSISSVRIPWRPTTAIVILSDTCRLGMYLYGYGMIWYNITSF